MDNNKKDQNYSWGTHNPAKIPTELLTEKCLLQADSSGNNGFHFVAMGEHLEQIPCDLLTVENLTTENHNKTTPLHYAANRGQLDQVPTALLTRTYMTRKDKGGNTPLHFAAMGGHIEQTPIMYHNGGFLIEENNDGTSILLMAISASGGLGFFPLPWGDDDPEEIPAEDWLQPPCMDEGSSDENLIALAASTGCLHMVPVEILTQLVEDDVADDKGNTLLHLAAHRGLQGQFPDELLTKDRLLRTNQVGSTCLHLAAKFGQLATIPGEILTKDNLLKRDSSGFTCLHLAAECSIFSGDGEFEYGCTLDQVPHELLTEQNLLLCDNVNEATVLEMATQSGKLKSCLHLIPSSLI